MPIKGDAIRLGFFAVALQWLSAFLIVMTSPLSAQTGTLSEAPWADGFRTFKQVPPIYNLSETQLAQLAPRAAELQVALKHGKAYFPNGAIVGGKIYVLADGREEAVMAHLMARVTKEKAAVPDLPIVVVKSYYPGIAMWLARYYVATAQPAAAIDALDEALMLSHDPSSIMGEYAPEMMSQKAVVLTNLGRYAEALAVYDQGLASKAISRVDRARLLRGRAFVLAETGRLDEAEAEYGVSLDMEPNNRLAKNEIVYIERVRTEGPESRKKFWLKPDDRSEQPAHVSRPQTSVRSEAGELGR